MEKTIVVVGSINMDMVIHTHKMPKQGETLKGDNFQVIPGGKGANQAISAARQGGQVQLIGCVGEDSYGRGQLKFLAKEKIGLSGVAALPGEKTGIAMIMVDSENQNSIVISPEANRKLSVAYLESFSSMIAKADILICQLEVPLTTISYAIEIASNNKTQVLLNPSPAMALPSALLQRVNYLVLNETEMSFLSKIDVTDLKSAKEAIRTLQDCGVDHVILTLGEKGVAWVENGKIQYQGALQIRAVDSTAAGDTFIGSFTIALVENKPIAEAILFAQHAASLSVTKLGAQTSIPNRSEVEAFMSRHQY